MHKKSSIILTFLLTLVFSGCSLGGGQTSETGGSILKSTDGGIKWENKVKIDSEKSIANVDVLAIAIDPANSKIIYIGTKEDGVFKTEDGGENWKSLDFPPSKTYSLVIDKNNTRVLYVVGVWQERGKIYKTEDGGVNWKEIYTEPANGTAVLSLALSPQNSQVVYAGTSEGAIFKTMNGGETWVNLTKAEDAVAKIELDSSNSEVVYFNLFEGGILRTKDGGKTFDDLGNNLKNNKIVDFGGQVFSLVSDPRNSGVVYAGMDKGILKSTDFGDNWNQLETLESSREFPVRAIAVNPSNPREIFFSAAQAIYKSTDGGAQWSTFQLQTEKVASVLQYDPQNQSIIYLGMKKVN